MRPEGCSVVSARTGVGLPEGHDPVQVRDRLLEAGVIVRRFATIYAGHLTAAGHRGRRHGPHRRHHAGYADVRGFARRRPRWERKAPST